MWPIYPNSQSQQQAWTAALINNTNIGPDPVDNAQSWGALAKQWAAAAAQNHSHEPPPRNHQIPPPPPPPPPPPEPRSSDFEPHSLSQAPGHPIQQPNPPPSHIQDFADHHLLPNQLIGTPSYHHPINSQSSYYNDTQPCSQSMLNDSRFPPPNNFSFHHHRPGPPNHQYYHPQSTDPFSIDELQSTNGPPPSHFNRHHPHYLPQQQHHPHNHGHFHRSEELPRVTSSIDYGHALAPEENIDEYGPQHYQQRSDCLLPMPDAPHPTHHHTGPSECFFNHPPGVGYPDHYEETDPKTHDPPLPEYPSCDQDYRGQDVGGDQPSPPQTSRRSKVIGDRTYYQPPPTTDRQSRLPLPEHLMPAFEEAAAGAWPSPVTSSGGGLNDLDPTSTGKKALPAWLRDELGKLEKQKKKANAAAIGSDVTGESKRDAEGDVVMTDDEEADEEKPDESAGRLLSPDGKSADQLLASPTSSSSPSLHGDDGQAKPVSRWRKLPPAAPPSANNSSNSCNNFSSLFTRSKTSTMATVADTSDADLFKAKFAALSEDEQQGEIKRLITKTLTAILLDFTGQMFVEVAVESLADANVKSVGDQTRTSQSAVVSHCRQRKGGSDSSPYHPSTTTNLLLSNTYASDEEDKDSVKTDDDDEPSSPNVPVLGGLVAYASDDDEEDSEDSDAATGNEDVVDQPSKPPDLKTNDVLVTDEVVPSFTVTKPINSGAEDDQSPDKTASTIRKSRSIKPACYRSPVSEKYSSSRRDDSEWKKKHRRRSNSSYSSSKSPKPSRCRRSLSSSGNSRTRKRSSSKNYNKKPTKHSPRHSSRSPSTSRHHKRHSSRSSKYDSKRSRRDSDRSRRDDKRSRHSSKSSTPSTITRRHKSSKFKDDTRHGAKRHRSRSSKSPNDRHPQSHRSRSKDDASSSKRSRHRSKSKSIDKFRDDRSSSSSIDGNSKEIKSSTRSRRSNSRDTTDKHRGRPDSKTSKRKKHEKENDAKDHHMSSNRKSKHDESSKRKHRSSKDDDARDEKEAKGKQSRDKEEKASSDRKKKRKKSNHH